MLIEISLMIIIILGFFSLIVGDTYISAPINVGIDNEALLNGSITTYIVEQETVLFEIDVSVFIISGIVLLVALGVIAGITGIQILASGLSATSVRVIIMTTAFTGLWIALSAICINLISSIEVFGSVIYIGITIMYAVGVFQKISGGSN